jgi:hypothetical protein
MANPANSTAYVGNDGRLWVDVTEAKTLAAEDSGYVQNCIASVTVTGPAAATNGHFVIRNGGAVIDSNGPDGATEDGMLIAFDPASADTVIGLNVADGTASDGKKLSNTAATARIGDELGVRYDAGSTNGPIVTHVKGIWAREA